MCAAVASAMVAGLALLISIDAVNRELTNPLVDAVLERKDAELARRRFRTKTVSQRDVWRRLVTKPSKRRKGDNAAEKVQVMIGVPLLQFSGVYVSIRHRLEAGVGDVKGLTGMRLFRSQILRDIDFMHCALTEDLPNCPIIKRQIIHASWVLRNLEGHTRLIDEYFSKENKEYKGPIERSDVERYIELSKGMPIY